METGLIPNMSLVLGNQADRNAKFPDGAIIFGSPPLLHIGDKDSRYRITVIRRVGYF